MRRGQKFIRLISMRAIFVASLLLFSMFSVGLLLPVVEGGSNYGPGLGDLSYFDGDFPWNPTGLDSKTDNTDYVTYTDYRTLYCTFASAASACDVTDDQKTIRIDTAEDLYRWSTDVSLSKYYGIETQKFTEAQVEVILQQDYALGNNIDYSTMASKKFSPIGYSFNETDTTNHHNVFEGTFDGQGFVISNLYVGGYDFMIYDDSSADIALYSFYSMFLVNLGEITNLGLVNPTLEMLNLHPSINKVSNLVGHNLGVLDHVFVLDTRTSLTDAGIRYNVGNSTGTFQAAGIVHTNEGQVSNAYYSSKVVVNGSYFNKFSAQPVIYTNLGTLYFTEQLAFDFDVYEYPTVTVGSSTFTVTALNGLATPESTTVLKSGSGSVLNDIDDRWYFYEDDSYPLTQGLDYVGGQYQISSAVDLVFFSRVLTFLTENNGVAYSVASYLLTTDIDMGILAPGAYQTPSVTFTGTFSGDNPNFSDEEGLHHNYYIYNMTINTGTVRSTGYYAGLFSIVTGAGNIHHLNLTDLTISLTDTESYYSNQFYIGSVAGRLTSAKIENVMVQGSIHLGSTSIGATHVGGIVGQASGIVSQVAYYGTINGGAHVFNSSYSIVPNYNIGGIVGASGTTSQLILSSVENNATITGFSTASTFTLGGGSTSINVKIGGVIGYILNSSTVRHRLVNAANTGGITVGSVINTVPLPSNQRIGGVFGELAGNAPILDWVDPEDEDVFEFYFGNLFNSGNITATYVADTSLIKAGGIGINNASEAVEYALMFNEGTFVFYEPTVPPTNPYPFRYTGTIYDMGSSAVTISRAYNYGNQTFSTKYYQDISPLCYSDNNNATLIQYSANYGNLLFYNSSGITLESELRISGITSNTNVNFLNVTNKGNITVLNVNVSANSLFVSGIAPLLAANKYMKNSLNEGTITVSGITGSANIYIAGLVTINWAGDLHEAGQPANNPKATEGVINSINNGSITTYYLDTTPDPDVTFNGINSTLRTFVAGIATLNSGSIQDTANSGNIYVYNSSAGSTTFQSTLQYGGRVSSYNASITAGGIVALTLSGTARIYDSANNGDITILSTNYARAGGILGVSFYTEASLGGISSGLGLEDTNNPIAYSKVANGLNFGNITALCSLTGAYDAAATTHAASISVAGGSGNGSNLYFVAPIGSTSRPGVYACAGGVVGYGLCIMTRMLNHGTISSSEVAGGVVGATYVLGGTGAGDTEIAITVVNIDTAINYGDIKAFPASSYSTMGKTDLTYNTVKTLFLADGNTTIFPTNLTREEPAAKRGFGGVFGRIQRGQFGVMTTKHPTTGELGKFNFIVNANPNIDLIGRLDQDTTFTGSSKYFRFNDAVYYSARIDDTTQAVFTGFYYAIGPILATAGSASPYTNTIRATTLYKNVGIVSTQFSTPGTSFIMRSSNSLAVYAIDEFYYAPIEVPWISETELWDSDFTSYVYDENFNMRKTEDSYTETTTREYTIDGVSGDLENPSGTPVITNALLFDTLGDAQTYKQSNPSAIVYYTDANGDIRNLFGLRVYVKGNPFSSTLAYTYNAYLSAYTNVKDNYYLTYNLDGSNNLVSATAAIPSTYLFASLATATSYDQTYNTAYYRAVSSTASIRGLYNAAGVRTHSTTTAYATYTYIAGTIPAGNIAAATLYRNTTTNRFYTNAGLTTLAIDSTVVFSSQAAATNYVKKTLYYYSGSDIYSFNNGTTALFATFVSTNLYRSVDGYYFVLSGGSLYRTVYSSQLFTSAEDAYDYKLLNPTVPVFYYDQYSAVWGKNVYIYSLQLKNDYYVSTNYTLNFTAPSTYVLVDSVGSTVLASGDLDGTPNTINPDNGNIYVTATGTVLYTYTPSLTEYVYYMGYNLLAPRFRNIIDGGTGINPRPNGMYVLSTTAGSTYGSVLPSNLDIDNLKPIHEDDEVNVLSLSANYGAISPQYLASLPTGAGTTYNGYLNLRQTIFNDKSNLFEAPVVPVTLTETGGGSSGTVLSHGTVDYVEKKITFTISMEAFTTGGVPVSYLVSHAETSASALVACRAVDYDYYTTLENYAGLLRTEGAEDVSTLYPAELTLTLPSKTITTNQTLTLGYFAVYSEAFVGSDLFAHEAYFTDYLVEVVFTPTIDQIVTGSLGITSVEFNGGAPVNVVNPLDVTALGTVAPAGSITFNFTDSKGVLTEGQDLSQYVSVVYHFGTNETATVSSSYYTLSFEAVTILAGTGTGSVTVTFTNQTRAGNYSFDYKYFASTPTPYSMLFDKGASSAAEVTGLNHYSSSGSVSIVGTAITSGVNLGYGITLGASQTAGNFTSSTAPGTPAYLDGTTYVVVYRSGYANTFTISPFATLVDAYLNGISYSNGYIVYDIRYVVQGEDASQITYTHTMTERAVGLTAVLKNGNEVSLSGIDAAREDEQTLFTIDLDLDQALDLYRLETSTTLPYIVVSATFDDGTGAIDISSQLSTYDLIFSVGDFLTLDMGYGADPGTYVFTFNIYRGNSGEYVTVSPLLTIVKNAGTNSHLTDIRFSQLATETRYPDILIVNELNQEITTSFAPAVYFGGIDYAGSDADQANHFRVKGYVSNTPLFAFLPLLTDYLPYGASIQRQYFTEYNNPATETWTAPVYADSSTAEKATLAANFTRDPYTGAETQNVAILYRVWSEDGNNYTYYYVIVEDVIFNVTLMFNIYYCTPGTPETCELASTSSAFQNELVMITIQNFETNGVDLLVNQDDPALYPTFTTIGDMKSQVTQFFFTYDGAYQYSFGRNMSGYFSFSLYLPQDHYLNDLYTYQIKFGSYTLNPIPANNKGIGGKYFWIIGANFNRSRSFDIYIRPIQTPETDSPWGLYDFFVSWWD